MISLILAWYFFPSLGRLLLDPAEGEMGVGGSLEPTEPQAHSLDSTAGLSPEELSTPLHTKDAAAEVAGEVTGAASLSPDDPNLAAATRQQAQAEQQAQTIREAAAFYGLDLSQFEDDGQAFAHLVQQTQQVRQANYYAQLGQQIAPHYAQVQQYLQQQQAQAQPKAERPAWEAPEFDERWMSLVDKDPNTGVYVAKPGVNPAFAEKVQAYADHVEKWTTTLARSPMDGSGPAHRERGPEVDRGPLRQGPGDAPGPADHRPERVLALRDGRPGSSPGGRGRQVHAEPAWSPLLHPHSDLAASRSEGCQDARLRSQAASPGRDLRPAAGPRRRCVPGRTTAGDRQCRQRLGDTHRLLRGPLVRPRGIRWHLEPWFSAWLDFFTTQTCIHFEL